MFIILKIIPLYTIWNTKINSNDLIMTFVLFSIYIIWIFFNKKGISDFEKQTMEMVLHNKNTLPGMIFIAKLLNLE